MEDPSFILPSTVNGDNKSSTGLDEPLDIEESLSSKKEPHTSSVSFGVPPTDDDTVPPTDDYNSYNNKKPMTNAGNRESIMGHSPTVSLTKTTVPCVALNLTSGVWL